MRRALLLLIFVLLFSAVAISSRLTERAWRLIDEGHYREAIRIADELISSGELEGYFIKARALYELGDPDAALNLLMRAKEMAPQNPRVYHNIGRVYALKAFKLREQGDENWRKLIDEAKLYFQRALELDSSYVGAAISLARVCYVTGEQGCFKEWLEYAMERAPDNPDVVRLRAMQLADEGRYATLRDYLEKRKQIVEGDFDLRKLLVRAYIETNEREEARALLGQLIKENPQDLELYYLLGKLYDRRRAFDVEDYIKGLGLPEDKMYVALALFWEAIGDVDAAVNYYMRAIDANPDDSDLYELFSTYLLSEGKYNQAIPVLKRFVELKPDYKSYYLLGMAYRHAGDPHKAIEYLEQAKRLNPKFPHTYIQLANAYLDIAFKLFEDLNYEGFKWYDKGTEVVKEAIANVDDPKYKARFEKSLKQLIRDRKEIKKKLDEAIKKSRG